MTDQPTLDQQLTHSQRQIWVGQSLNPESPLYNMAFSWVFAREIDSDLFNSAWRRVYSASDALRSRIVTGATGATVKLAAPDSSATEVIDLRSRPDALRAFRNWCEERCSRTLSLDGALVDSVLARLPEGRTGWYLNLHHLISDAWSTMLLYRQVAAEYGSLGGGRQVEPLAAYYPTARELVTRGAPRAAATEHWSARNRGRQMPLYGRPGRARGTASTRLTLELGEKTSTAIDQLSAAPGFVSLSRDMSRFAVFASLLSSWLYRLGAENEIAFDAPVTGRPTAAAKSSLGLFIEMFPFRTTVETGDTFRTLGARCLDETTGFLRYALPGVSSPSGSSANSVVLNFFPGTFGEFAGIPARVEWVHPGHGDSVHALRLQVHDFDGTGCYRLHFDFNDQALPEVDRERSLRHFERLLGALIENPDRAIAEVDLLTDDERAHLAVLDVADRGPAPRQSVVDRIRARVEATPQRVALREPGGELTFGAFWEQTEALGAALVAQGVVPGDRVAILSRRSIEAVVAVIATLRVGAAFVPLDPSHPETRIAGVLADSQARVVLVGDGIELASPTDGLIRRSIGAEIESGRGAVLEHRDRGLDELAYLIFTSGSTGRPKGVLIDHLGLADYVAWAERQYVRGDRLSFALFTSLAVDLTITSLFLPLITGGTMEIYPETEGSVDAALLSMARADEVDFVKLTPSHLSLLRRIGLEGTRIRRMVVGGEDFKVELAAAVSAQCADRIEIYNEYGPTEAVVGCTVHRFDRYRDLGASVPIGLPGDHVSLRVLNRSRVAEPPGVPGELWISRLGLARGYDGLADLTAASFQPDPAGTDRTYYRTGDRVRLAASGGLEYLGRLDRQLKISGFRVEPGEIEAALQSLRPVEACTVLLRDPGHPQGEPRFCVHCGLASSYPTVAFDEEGRCNICRAYEASATQIEGYFRGMDELRELFEASRRETPSSYDCLMLLSGGKDSTYALSRLVEMGLSVYCYTFDNGFISEDAKANIRRTTEHLGVALEVGTTPTMNAIFRDSLTRFSNVCQGCFKTIYTLSLKRARELGIPIIVTGLSRGQMFETRLAPEMFRDGRRTPAEIDAAVLEARKVYHRADDEVSRSLGVEIFRDDRIFEEVRFVDFYRYCDVGLEEVLSHLERAVPWIRPADTGRSTNCLINDVGIHIHQKERGFHNYALPYSWDVRLGHKTRQEALEELDDEIDLDRVRGILAEIDYDENRLDRAAAGSQLTAFYVATSDIGDEELRQHLASRLPAPLIPAAFHRIDALPLTASGKIDRDALLRIDLAGAADDEGSPPQGAVERYLAEVWAEQLGLESRGEAATSPHRIGRESNFFSLGGTSLRAMEVMIRLCGDLDIDLPLDTLVHHLELRELAAVVEERMLAEMGPAGQAGGRDSGGGA